MAKRTTSDFKYAFGNNSEAVKNYMTSKSIMAEFKKEYTRMRDIERKQIQRLQKSEFSQLQSAQQKLAPKLEEFYTKSGKFKKSAFANEFAKMQRFLESERRTVTGQKAIRTRTISKLQSRGYDVNTENYAEFVALMEELRRRGLDSLYDSAQVIKTYFASNGNRKISPQGFNTFFEEMRSNSGHDLDDVE